MSRRYLKQLCQEAPDGVLVSALVDYLDDRESWTTDAAGNSRPAAERRLGVCALCGSVLRVHFVVHHDSKTTDITPEHPKYEAVRAAFCSDGGEVRTPGAGAPVIHPRYFCESAHRNVGRMPIRPPDHEGPMAALVSAYDRAVHLRKVRDREDAKAASVTSSRL